MTKFLQATVRLAGAADIEPLAKLCQYLGYPASPAEVQQRLSQIQSDEQHAVYVAEIPNEYQVVGWVHVYTRQLMLTNLQAEIGGIVVDQRHRHIGIGRFLMQHAEMWALEKGCEAITLRSNILRKDAHIFYERVGYRNIKTLLAFYKVLD
jgi:GNAT superfamily N-acetyltransferase